MPAGAILPYVIKALINYAAPGVASVINRLWFQGSQNATNTSLNTAAQAMANSWNTNMAPQTTAGVQLIAIELEDLSQPTAANGIWTGSKPGSSGAGGSATPAVSFIIKNVVQDRYRGGHSRIYLPGIALSNVSANDATTWNTTQAATVTGAWAQFLKDSVTALQTAGAGSVSACVPQLYRGHTWVHTGTPPNDYYKYKATPNTASPIPTPTYTSVFYNDVLGTQRRRTHQTG